MSGRPIARLNATDVNVFFDNSSTSKKIGAVYQSVRDTEQGAYDVHEHDVLLQQAAQPIGIRQLSVFSSMRNQPYIADGLKIDDEKTIKHYVEHYKFSGLAVTPYTPRLGSDGFQQGQGFVATFTGLNVVRVAEDCVAGDILVAVPPLQVHMPYIRDVIGKHTSSVMLVVPTKWIRNTYGQNTCKLLSSFVVGRCVGGAKRGSMATVVLGPYSYECEIE